MHEELNHWTFVITAYAITVLGTGALIVMSLLAMHAAEARRDKARER
jgi:heme exporter protein D